MMREGVTSVRFSVDFFVMDSCWFADHCLEKAIKRCSQLGLKYG